jgi:hypothetical protein
VNVKMKKILLIKARGEPADARVRDDKEKLDAPTKKEKGVRME